MQPVGRLLYRYVACGVPMANLCLCNLGSKERHKAATRNGDPQGGARVVSFANLCFA